MRRRRSKARKARLWRDAFSVKRRRRVRALERAFVETDYDEPLDDLVRGRDLDPWIDV